MVEPAVVGHACNPSTADTKIGREVWDERGQHSKTLPQNKKQEQLEWLSSAGESPSTQAWQPEFGSGEKQVDSYKLSSDLHKCDVSMCVKSHTCKVKKM